MPRRAAIRNGGNKNTQFGNKHNGITRKIQTQIIAQKEEC